MHCSVLICHLLIVIATGLIKQNRRHYKEQKKKESTALDNSWNGETGSLQKPRRRLVLVSSSILVVAGNVKSQCTTLAKRYFDSKFLSELLSNYARSSIWITTKLLLRSLLTKLTFTKGKRQNLHERKSLTINDFCKTNT